MLPARDSWPVGFGFRPTDEELITHYLKNKMLGYESLVRCIRVIDLYKYEPWELPKLSVLESDNHEWFFFLAQSTSGRGPKTKRTTRTGYWKSTGEDRKIKARGTNKVIGTRKILVFHKGRSPNGVKSNWIIHEYRLYQDTNIRYLRSFVLCRLKRKSDENDVLIRDEVEPNDVDPIVEDIRGHGEASQDFTTSKYVSTIPIDNENHFHEGTPNANNTYQIPGNGQSSQCPFSNNEDSQAADISKPDKSGTTDGDLDIDEFIRSLLDGNFSHEGTRNANNAFYQIPGIGPSLYSSLFSNAEPTLIDSQAAYSFKPYECGPTDEGFHVCESPRSVLEYENLFLGGTPDGINAHQFLSVMKVPFYEFEPDLMDDYQYSRVFPKFQGTWVNDSNGKMNWHSVQSAGDSEDLS